MNDTYSSFINKGHVDDPVVTKDGIQATQRKWFKYRDAWGKFAGLRYPSTSSEIWKTWLTKQRI
ncbi:MAG: DUF1311 domain-containing protein [Bacteriovorax sp.]|nr:DUF1311 domain-containing protein [Bacteriovorax sp.]